MPSLLARSMMPGVAKRVARWMGSYLGRVHSPRMTRSGWWDSHQEGLRTSEGEAQITGARRVAGGFARRVDDQPGIVAEVTEGLGEQTQIWKQES
jgi:hypothetical protein